jgi:hypothetical protein
VAEALTQRQQHEPARHYDRQSATRQQADAASDQLRLPDEDRADLDAASNDFDW